MDDTTIEQRHRRVPVTRRTDERAIEETDHVVAEEPFEIRACGPGQAPVTLVTTMRTPGHDIELAVGWLFSEGLVAPGEIVGTDTGDPVAMSRPDDQLTVRLTRQVDLTAGAQRHATATASCGVCGRAAIDELALRCEPVASSALADPPLAWSLVASLPDRLRDAQPVFSATGGLHATGIFEPDGTLVVLREDVGRHNALDAAIGERVLAADVPLDSRIAVLSGRVGFELVVKAAAAGLPVLAAVGAPTDLAIRTAERFGITLVGFLRRGTGNVYTHGHRVRLDA